MTYEDRLLLAGTQLALTYERRDNWLSDDDVLDAVDAWTDGTDGDYDRLSDDLFGWLCAESEANHG